MDNERIEEFKQAIRDDFKNKGLPLDEERLELLFDSAIIACEIELED